jgi:hypothetical protein
MTPATRQAECIVIEGLAGISVAVTRLSPLRWVQTSYLSLSGSSSSLSRAISRLQLGKHARRVAGTLTRALIKFAQSADSLVCKLASRITRDCIKILSNFANLNANSLPARIHTHAQ